MRARKRPTLLLCLVPAALLGVAVSLGCILLFALAMQKGWLGSAQLAGATVGVKLLSAAVAALLAIRLYKPRAWLTGGLAGVSYAALAFAAFSLLSDTFVFSWAILSDLGMGLCSGLLTALVARALK